jgi:hypothetical protein
LLSDPRARMVSSTSEVPIEKFPGNTFVRGSFGIYPNQAAYSIIKPKTVIAPAGKRFRGGCA